MAAPPQTDWQLSDPALCLRRWVGELEVLAFAEATGDLHLVTLGAAAVLEALEGRPSSSAALAAALGQPIGLVEELLASLDVRGLVEPGRP